ARVETIAELIQPGVQGAPGFFVWARSFYDDLRANCNRSMQQWVCSRWMPHPWLQMLSSVE
ncbi:MAG: hypothetical protein AAGG44_10200, partial [Planctomycetota bacterium]